MSCCCPVLESELTAIHLQNKFDVLKNDMDLEDAFLGIFKTAGKAIVWNGVVVTAGFLTLIFSQMPPNQKLGLICSLGIATKFNVNFSRCFSFSYHQKHKALMILKSLS